MLKTYKILSLLLSYPNADLQEFLADVVPELTSEALLDTDKIAGIGLFIDHFGKQEVIDWQAEYVQLFDYSRSVSLHLFEHVKGDSKDRGQAMVDLMEFYRENGMQLSSKELPDYIPVFLEFLSTLEAGKAAETLAEVVHVIQRIHLALQEKAHPYRHVLSSIVALSAKKPGEAATKQVIRNEKPLDLDAEYEEEPVVFGSDPSCINCKLQSYGKLSQ